MACSEPHAFATFRAGFVRPGASWSAYLTSEARGARFELVDGGRFRVSPSAVLTAADRAFLREHRDSARACIEYVQQVCEVPRA